MDNKVSERNMVMSKTKLEENDKFQNEMGINFLLKTKSNGVFYRCHAAAFFIPIQRGLGYKVYPFRLN